jgi:hypothetical protein
MFSLSITHVFYVNLQRGYKWFEKVIGSESSVKRAW